MKKGRKEETEEVTFERDVESLRLDDGGVDSS